MDFEPENAPSEALLADRLARLAAWRCAATRRRSSLSSGGSDDEGNQRVRPRCTAAQALKELLQGRAAVLDGAALRAGTRDVTEDGSSCEAVDVPVPLPVPLVPIPSHPCGALVPGSDGQPSECSDDCGSVPPTARLLIQLSSGVGRAEAAGERLQRAAELRAADAAVRDAEAQRAELDALLLRQRASEAQREQQRAERQAELARMELDLATQHMAAWRIGRAWCRFLASPGRLRAVAAATRIQALWRGCVSRRRTAAELQALRRLRGLLANLHAAASAGDLARAQAAAQQLGGMGAGPQAARQVAQLEQLAAEAEAALRAAAARGGAEAYRAAAAAAQRYAHLEGARHEAARQFAARVAAAEAAVETAAQGGPVLQFKEAARAAAALGVSSAVLVRAEQRVALRQQEVASALVAALAAVPFDGQAFQRALEHGQRCGLHADAARSQRGLHLRRHRAAAALQQLAAEGGHEEVEAACSEAVQLGLDAEAGAALLKLEQRQEAAAERLRQAAHRGLLQEFQAADAAAAAVQVSDSLRQSCAEQVRQRQSEAEQQLRAAASGHGDLAVICRLCHAAAQLGLAAAVAEAEQVVQRRREQAVKQLVRSTQLACDGASAAAQAAERGAANEPTGDAASPRQLMGGWLAAAQQLAAAVEERIAAAAFEHPPSACCGWPAELRGWLADARQAAGLELAPQVLAATVAIQGHLEALHTAAHVAMGIVPLGEGPYKPEPCGNQPSSTAALQSGWGLAASSGAWIPADAATKRLRDACQPATGAGAAPAAAGDQDLLARFQKWRASQEHLLPLVAGAAQRAAAVAGLEAEAEAEAEAAGRGDQAPTSLDLSRQGLQSLELLADGSPVTHLDLRSNALSSLEALSALHSLRELRAANNRVASLHGVHMLGGLTHLDVAHNSLERLPSLAGLPALLSLNLSGNRLTAAAMTAAGLCAGAGAQLTCLRLAGNSELTELGSWLGPLPSLLRLEVSGCGLHSLEGLEAAAPLLQDLGAAGNQLASLPPSLGLPFLRELWLGGNRLACVPAWPWLPSLQGLHLQGNQLTHLAPLSGFLCLQAVDLSFNQLASLGAALASLAPAGATLRQLHLNDNPWGAPGGGAQLQQHMGAVTEQAYSAAVFRALPRLQELNSQPVDPAEQRQHLRAAALRRPPVAAWQARRQTGIGWDAATLMWLLAQPASAGQVAQARDQQHAMAFASMLPQAEEQPASDTAGVASLAAVLASLQQAAASGQMAMQAPPSGGIASGGGRPDSRSGRSALCLAQQQYLLLVAGQPSAAQSLVLLNPAHYQDRLAQMHHAAACIQAAWRGYRARRLRAQWVSQQRAAREAAAASAIQAAWCGWWCRQRRCRWVQHRLVVWRHEWREAQRRLLLHQRGAAAVRIQAAWRGARVRGLVRLARLALQQRRQQPRAAHPGSPELDAELSAGSLGGLLDAGASSLFASPEVLQPELAAGGSSPGDRGARGDGLAAAHAGGSSAAPAAPAGREPAGARTAGACGNCVAGAPAQHAHVAGSCTPGGTEPGAALAGAACDASDWQFADPATAAAYAQLRQRQQAAAQRRTLQRQMKDPLQRLHHFQCRSATLPARAGGAISGDSGGASPAAAGPGCLGGDSTCSRTELRGLPSLRSPRPIVLGLNPGCGGSTAVIEGKSQRGRSPCKAQLSAHILQLATL